MCKTFFLSLILCICQFAASSAQDSIAIGLNIGNRAPELVLPDKDGRLVALSSLRGKVVLIHFWASWYGPGRWLNPKRVLTYTEFRDKEFKNGHGFEIYSVSIDNQREKWLDAIEKDNLFWPYHVSDLKWWKTAAAKPYKLDDADVPGNYLIDENGIILAKDLDIKEKGNLNLDEVLKQYLK